MGRIKDRKLYVGVLALALGGLALDKTLLRGGLSPGAAEASEALAVEGDEAIAPAPAPPSENSAEVAERLEQARLRLGLDPSQVTDAFFAAGLSKAAAVKDEELSPPDAFRARCRLHAVAVSRLEGGVQLGGAALVETEVLAEDGKKVNTTWRWDVGRTVDGWTLESVDARTALFKSNDYAVTLSLPKPLESVAPPQTASKESR